MSRVFEALQRSGMMPETTQLEPREIPLAEEIPSFVELPIEFTTDRPAGLEATPALPCKLDGPGRLSALKDHGDIGSEKFSVLSTRLNYLQQARAIKRLLITSSSKEEGKSLMAANTAISLARHSKKKVLLIEGDLRRPKLSSVFGVQGLEGMSEQLTQKIPSTRNLFRFQDLNLWCLFAGKDSSRPVELLQSPRLPTLLNEFNAMFDWILIDAPPVAAVTDADLWSRMVDGVLVVVREGVTSKKLLRQTLKSIRPNLLCGVILNEAKEARSYYQHYHQHAEVVVNKQENIP
jgi:capsular exopolysaccharide synthesis family protein